MPAKRKAAAAKPPPVATAASTRTKRTKSDKSAAVAAAAAAPPDSSPPAIVAPGTGRHKKLFDLLLVLIPNAPYDVLAMITAYDKECVMLFVDENFALTVFSVDEMAGVTTQLPKPTLGADSNIPYFGFFESQNLTNFCYQFAPPAPGTGSNSAGGGGYLLTLQTALQRRNLLQLLHATSAHPLDFKVLSATAGTDLYPEYVTDDWQSWPPIATCVMPGHKILVAANVVGRLPSLNPTNDANDTRTDWMLFDTRRGANAIFDPLTIRTNRPDGLKSLSGAVRRLIRLQAHASAGDASACAAQTKQLRDAIRGYYKHDDTAAAIGVDKPEELLLPTTAPAGGVSTALLDPKSLPPQRRPDLQTNVAIRHLIPFPKAPYQHVVVWIGSNPDSGLCEFGVFDTATRTDVLIRRTPVLDPNASSTVREEVREHISEACGQVRHTAWLVTPAATRGGEAGYALSLIFTTPDGIWEFGGTGSVIFPVAARSTDATACLSAWCDAARIKHLTSAKANPRGPPQATVFTHRFDHDMYRSDGSARVVSTHPCGANTVVVFTPVCDVAKQEMSVKRETLKRCIDDEPDEAPIQPARRKPGAVRIDLPKFGVVVLDDGNDRIAFFSERHIRVWNISAPKKNGAYRSVEIAHASYSDAAAANKLPPKIVYATPCRY